FFFSSRRRHTRFSRDWSSDVCSSDLWLVCAVLGLPCVVPVQLPWLPCVFQIVGPRLPCLCQIALQILYQIVLPKLPYVFESFSIPRWIPLVWPKLPYVWHIPYRRFHHIPYSIFPYKHRLPFDIFRN